MRTLLFALVIAAACGKNNEPPPPSSGSPNDQPESGPTRAGAGGASDGAAKAQALFGQMCATCHGASGHGDGPMAKALTPKPRDYTDPAWQASVTDDQIRDIIIKGGAAVGKSSTMPPWPDVAKEPGELDALVQIIRGFGKHP
jgi:mono/diheme cytochrome c family protein